MTLCHLRALPHAPICLPREVQCESESHWRVNKSARPAMRAELWNHFLINGIPLVNCLCHPNLSKTVEVVSMRKKPKLSCRSFDPLLRVTRPLVYPEWLKSKSRVPRVPWALGTGGTPGYTGYVPRLPRVSGYPDYPG